MNTFRQSFKHFLLLALLSPLAVAAEFNDKEPLLCAIRDVNECAAGVTCMEVSAEEVSLPDFMEIRLDKKQITSVGPIDQGSTPIERIERLNGKLILQGGDASGDNPRGGVGWTMTINEATGKMVVAGVGDEFALVVFGSCVQR